MAMTASPGLCKQQFFRALSASAWAHSGELLFAEPVTDDALVTTLRHLGMSYGLGVSSLGIHQEQLDELPPASEIMEMDLERVESLLDKLDPFILVPPAVRKQPDAYSLEEIRKNAPHIRKILDNLHGVLSS